MMIIVFFLQACMKDIPSSEWLQQWTDLARRFAFQYNPALQPRAIIVFGCISKTVTDSEVKQLLKIMMKVSVMSVSKLQLCSGCCIYFTL